MVYGIVWQRDWHEIQIGSAVLPSSRRKNRAVSFNTKPVFAANRLPKTEIKTEPATVIAKPADERRPEN